MSSPWRDYQRLVYQRTQLARIHATKSQHTDVKSQQMKDNDHTIVVSSNGSGMNKLSRGLQCAIMVWLSLRYHYRMKVVNKYWYHLTSLPLAQPGNGSVVYDLSHLHINDLPVWFTRLSHHRPGGLIVPQLALASVAAHHPSIKFISDAMMHQSLMDNLCIMAPSLTSLTIHSLPAGLLHHLIVDNQLSSLTLGCYGRHDDDRTSDIHDIWRSDHFYQPAMSTRLTSLVLYTRPDQDESSMSALLDSLPSSLQRFALRHPSHGMGSSKWDSDSQWASLYAFAERVTTSLVELELPSSILADDVNHMLQSLCTNVTKLVHLSPSPPIVPLPTPPPPPSSNSNSAPSSPSSSSPSLSIVASSIGDAPILPISSLPPAATAAIAPPQPVVSFPRLVHLGYSSSLLPFMGGMSTLLPNLTTLELNQRLWSDWPRDLGHVIQQFKHLTHLSLTTFWMCGISGHIPPSSLPNMYDIGHCLRSFTTMLPSQKGFTFAYFKGARVLESLTICHSLSLSYGTYTTKWFDNFMDHPLLSHIELSKNVMANWRSFARTIPQSTHGVSIEVDEVRGITDWISFGIKVPKMVLNYKQMRPDDDAGELEDKSIIKLMNRGVRIKYLPSPHDGAVPIGV